MALFAAFADFGRVWGSEAGEKNGREREEGGPGRCHRPDAEVRRLPQESPRTRGSRRDRARKNPNRERLGFHYWWSWGELNPRPSVLYLWLYMLSVVYCLTSCRPTGRVHSASPVSFNDLAPDEPHRDPVLYDDG